MTAKTVSDLLLKSQIVPKGTYTIWCLSKSGVYYGAKDILNLTLKDWLWVYNMTAATTIPALRPKPRDVKKLKDNKNNPKAVFKTAIKLAVNK